MIDKPLAFINTFGKDARIVFRVKMPLECDNFTTSLSFQVVKGTTLYENISSLRRYARSFLKNIGALCVDAIVEFSGEPAEPGYSVLLFCVVA